MLQQRKGGTTMSGTRTLVIGVLALTTATPAAANPWTRDQGSYYVNLSYTTIGASSYYDPTGETLPIGSSYRQHAVGLYTEVGIIDRWLTGVFDANLYRRSSLEDQGSVHGFGDLRLGLRSGLLVEPLRLTAGLMVGVPTGDPVPDPGPASLPTGDGEPDAELSLSAGKGFGGGGSWWPLKHYAIAELGYWFRTRSRANPSGPAGPAFADAINWRFELGINLPWKVIERAWIMGRVFGSESLAGDDEVQPGFSGLGNGVTHRSYAFEIYVKVWRGLGLSFTRSGAWFARGIAAGAQYRAALSWEV
jgi:hypothetical protein